ncbi:MAG: hypothetical protein SVV03_01585, partial [Candidatus Nanohaloarchaea archaeon]|nr:hypothetical protein [Candidatus Nanohaloarchaea archaeon]
NGGGAELLNFPQYFHPDTGLANSLTANGSINGSLVEGRSYNRQDITFVNRSSGRRFLEFDGRFDLEDVDLDELTIEATDNKVAVNTSGTTGMSDNHTLFVPNNNNGSGVRVCPGASTAGDVGSGCPDSINFSGPFPETKDGITADLANSGKELSLVNRFGITDDVRGVEIKPDGTKMFLPVRKGGDEILAYNLSTPWDVSTAKFSQSMSATQIRDVQFKPDGTEMFRSWTGVYSDKIIEYHLSTPWDISTASSVNSEKFGIENERGFTISEDGKVLYTGYNDQIVEFEMSTPWDTSTMSQTETKDLSEDIPGSDGWNGITILDKGKELQVISDGFNEDAVLLTYKLSEAFNLSTAKLVQRINMTQFNDSERFTGLVFGKDKSWMYSYESKHQFVGQYGVVTRSGEYRLDGFTKDGGGGLLGPVGEEEEPVTGDTTAPLVECSDCHAKDVVDVGEDQVFTPVVNDSSNFTVYICGDRECSSQDLLCINSSGSKCTSSAGPDWDSSQNYWVRAIDSAGNSRKVYGGRFIVRKELLDIGRKKKVNISLEGEDTRVLYVHNSDGVPHSYVLETEVSEGDGRLFTSLSSGGESGEDFIRFEVDSKSTRSIVSTFRAASCYRRCVKDVTFVLRNLETGETDSVTVPVEIERKETGVSAPGIGLFHFVFIAFLSLVYLFYRKVPAARDSS